ncbi:LysR family transcriptional regulator, partial [Burkholderia cenocepacia]|nr:LysR family transcriptional regulator [Burkholderia cenocepacia]
ARRVGLFECVTVASPDYLERHGEPQTIDDLNQHKAVNYFSSRTGRTIDWTFLIDGKEVEMKMEGIVSVNDADAYVT